METAKRIGVEELLSRLQAQKSTRRVFNLGYSEEELTRLLTASYKVEVEKAGAVYKSTDDIAHAISVSATWLAKQPTTGLFLRGTCGNGKTTLMRAIVWLIRAITFNNAIKDNSGYNVETRWYSATELARMCQKDEKNGTSAFDEAREFPSILAIDDVGNEPTEVMHYGNIIAPLAEIFSSRYERRRFTICTSNLCKEGEIKAKYETRIEDRFYEMMTIVNFNNPTYRRINY